MEIIVSVGKRNVPNFVTVNFFILNYFLKFLIFYIIKL